MRPAGRVFETPDIDETVFFFSTMTNWKISATLFCRRMENRDQRRWAIADEDDDGTLNKIEFKHFLHPEEADHMREIVVQVCALACSSC